RALGDGVLPAAPPRLPAGPGRAGRGVFPLLRGRGPVPPGVGAGLVGLVRAGVAGGASPAAARPPRLARPAPHHPPRAADVRREALAGLAVPTAGGRGAPGGVGAAAVGLVARAGAGRGPFPRAGEAGGGSGAEPAETGPPPPGPGRARGRLGDAVG